MYVGTLNTSRSRLVWERKVLHLNHCILFHSWTQEPLSIFNSNLALMLLSLVFQLQLSVLLFFSHLFFSPLWAIFYSFWFFQNRLCLHLLPNQGIWRKLNFASSDARWISIAFFLCQKVPVVFVFKSKFYNFDCKRSMSFIFLNMGISLIGA